MLISISGQDKPGLMAELMERVVADAAEILDIGQAVIHDELALGLLLRTASFEGLRSSLEEHCQAVNAALRITSVSEDNYRQWSQSQWISALSESPLILTLLARRGDALPMLAVSRLTRKFGLNIDTLRRLTQPQPEGGASDNAQRLCIEIRVSGQVNDLDGFQSQLLEQADSIGFDFSVQRDTVFRRNRRLVAFDMDSTLIAEEVMDELAARHGVGEEVAAITAKAMAGELDFKASFRARAALLKGMPLEVLHEVAESVVLNSGADRLLRALKHFGYSTALLSGGFQYVGDHLALSLGIDDVYANELEVVDGVMTGEVVGDIVDAQRKAELLKQIAMRDQISLAQTIAVGDGANDLPMLRAAGLGVAYHAKSVVRASAKHAISNFGLDAILYLIGFSDLDVEQAFSEAKR